MKQFVESRELQMQRSNGSAVEGKPKLLLSWQAGDLSSLAVVS